MAISSELPEAYLRAEYRVFTPEGAFALSAAGESQELWTLHARYNVSASAFITAYNPRSQLTSEPLNQRNQELLRAEIHERWEYLIGEGVDPSGLWPGEPSLLVFGITEEAALELGRRYQQNAILIGDAEGRTRLMFCFPEDIDLGGTQWQTR